MDKEIFLKEKEELDKKIEFYLLSYKGGLTLTGLINEIINLTDKSEIQKNIALNILRKFIDKKIIVSNNGFCEKNNKFSDIFKENNIEYCNECSELISQTLNQGEFNINEETFYCSLNGAQLERKENSSKILIPTFCKKNRK